MPLAFMWNGNQKRGEIGLSDVGMTGVIYLIVTLAFGSVPFGLIVGHYVAGIDVRDVGSGNIGATNVGRALGFRWGVITMGLDILKGALPVWIAGCVADGTGFAGCAALAAFAGHCWSVFLEFRGGKGVATAGGAMLALTAWPTLAAILVWGGLRLGTGRASIASLAAAGVLVLAVALAASEVLWVALVLAVGVVIRHRDNIERLWRGEELRSEPVWDNETEVDS